MTPAQNRRNLALFATVLAALLVFAAPGGGEPSQPGAGPLPLLGTADPGMVLMGARPDGEAWGYRQLPLDVGGVRVGPRSVPVAAAAGNPPEPQLAFTRYTEATGWQVFATPLDAGGNPYRGPVPNPLSARIAPGGGGVLVGRDLSRPAGEQVTVLRRDPGANWRVLDGPPADVLLPAEGEAPPEALAGEGGSGAVADAAFDAAGGRTGLMFGPQGRSVAPAIVVYDGTEWRRETVYLPPALTGSFHIRAIAATGLGNAWAIAETDDPALNRSVVLLERTTTPEGPLWVERPLAGTPFREASDPADGIMGAAPVPGAAQPLTLTQDGAWIDLTAQVDGVERDVSLYYDIGAEAVTGSWCDDPICGGALGVRFSRQAGYRSFAWAGGDFGTRIVTNPLDAGGGDETNRGTYLRFADGAFARLPGAGTSFRPSGAFASPDRGWLEGPVEISAKAQPRRLHPWPISLRAPLADVTAAPGGTAASAASGALAVGAEGAVLRYEPGRGWQREFLLSSGGSVNKSNLRGVAWPEPARAHAVGDSGAMWMWNAADGLWVPDPGVPIGFEGNLMDVAFDPADPDRGYAVGKGGALLAYGKSWDQVALPPGFERANLTSIAFAGSEAIVAAGGDLLVNDGGGWRVDASAHALLDGVRAGSPQLYAVAGLPDGGAVAAGRDIVIERDGPGAPWRFSDQPLPGATAIAAAAVRAGGSVRAVVSVVPQVVYPPADDLPPEDPTVPPPILPPFPLPGDGYLLRETASGWVDEQRTAFAGFGDDRPLKSDPVLALLLDPGGNGWAVGGWSGATDSVGRGTSARGGSGRAVRERVQTAAVYRYGDGGAEPPAAGRAAVPMPAGPVRLAVAGNAECDAPCSELERQAIGPDRNLAAAVRTASELAGGNGPRALLYTGNRVKTGLGEADAFRFAQLLGSSAGIPVFPALGSSDVAGGAGAAAFEAAFSAFPAPLGSAGPPAGFSTAGIPGAVADPSRARTHYAFDSAGPGGSVRVVVIDNSQGSLAASDPQQNPPEPQLPWLEAVLADARADGVPAVVMGNRSLNPNFTPELNVASDGNQVAQALLAGGASAYLFDRPEENRVIQIPAASQQTLPSFGVGSLGYRSQVSGAVGQEVADSLFGDAGLLVLEVNAAQRDPATNRAPVGVRLVPLIEELSLEATDGTLLRRSWPALFRGLGRRPRGGDRWGRASAGSGVPDPAGGDPYTLFPPAQCLVAGCATRVAPEYSFTSSDPDIADFVKQDPNSTNLRKPYIDANDKVVTDNTSSLLCPFNAGTTTVTVAAGGFSYSEQVRVQPGSVQRPCGTRPLRPDRFKRAAPGAAPPAPPPPPSSPPSSPPVSFEPPALAPPAPPAPPAPQPPPAPSPPPLDPFVPLVTGLALGAVPAIVPPPPPPVVRPLPPGGAPARTYQVEEKREEEAAIEESKAFSRHEEGREGLTVPPYLPALVLILALAGASVRGGPGPGTRHRRRERHRPAPATTAVIRQRSRR
ncbi:MAG TPA: hypothetical protein VFN92_00740 [Solirubrobacterales bacterium]|nr:hypothetical protein [Solirubrobacterales bacterium]